MIFNSIEFLSFFTAFFFLYWFVFNKSVISQNLLILGASYVFYAWWDWRYLILLVGITAFSYYLGLLIDGAKPKRKQILAGVAIFVGISVLIIFKYYNFFINSFTSAFNINLEINWLNIVLPLGISFYIFRSLSYVLDVKNGKIEVCKNWLIFFTYVAFFPSLISGPIDRAKTLFPQFEALREFNTDKAKDGMLQILWGLFKKMVIANNCASFTNNVFDDYSNLPGSTLLLACFLYTIQVYADFSGYSDMAIGIARLLGFEITKNFDFPLFSQNIAEFWRKWHMSLTSWLTDFVFTPLSIALRDFGKVGLLLSIVLNFTLIGIWHGDKWTYVLFGFLHGVLFTRLILKGTMNKKVKTDKTRLLPSLKEFINMVITFISVMLTFVVFRSSSVQDAFQYFDKLLSFSIFTCPEISSKSEIIKFLLVVAFLGIEWLGRLGNYGLEFVRSKFSKPMRWSIYYIILIIIFIFSGINQQFIYFQF